MLYVEWENAICRMTISCTVWCTLFECSIMRPLFARKQCQAAGAAKQRTGQLVHGCAEKHRGRTSPPSAHEHASAPDTAARPRRFWFVGYDQLQSRARRCTILACRIIQPPVRGVSLPSKNWCYRECPRALMQVQNGNTKIYKLSLNRWPGL